MKQFAVLHTEKGKGSGGGLGNHIDRSERMGHTYRHSDPGRKHLNREFASKKYRNLSVPEAVKLRIKEGYTKKTAIRKDAVKYLSTVLTGSAEQMQKIFENEESKNQWILANAEFAKAEFGEKNIVRFTLHLDEKTPHIHVVHVPITKDGGLSARQYIGNRKMLSQMQDRYANAMQRFGLERGVKNTGISHDTAKEYYKRISIIEKEVDNIEVKGVFGTNKDKTIEKLRKALKTQILAIEREKKEVLKMRNSVENSKKYRNTAEDRAFRQLEKARALKKELETILKMTPAEFERMKFEEKLLKLEKEKNRSRNFGLGL